MRSHSNRRCNSLPPPRATDLREFRVAVWCDDAACPVDETVQARLRTTADALRRAGVAVDETARPALRFADAYRLYLQLLWAAISAGVPREVYEMLLGMSTQLPAEADDVTARFARFVTQRYREWLPANERRQKLRAVWAEFFRNFDVLVCPITPTAAIGHDHSQPYMNRTISVNGQTRPYLDQIAWAGLIGMVYLPATMAPVGRTPGGLPVGVQIVGPYLEDCTTIEFARCLAEVIGGFEAPPGF